MHFCLPRPSLRYYNPFWFQPQGRRAGNPDKLMYSGLLLTMRAEIGGPAAQDNPPNFNSAGQTRLAGPVVNLKMILKFSAPVDLIQTGSLMRDSGVQHLANSIIQFF